MNRDANPFFGTNQPSQVSGPDELLAEQLDKILATGDWEPTVPAALLERCRAHIAANAALAARCGELERALAEARQIMAEHGIEYARSARRALASQAEGETG